MIFLFAEPNQIGELDIDVTETEEHQFESEVTSYPVEDGTSRSDHIIQSPLRIGLTGIVSDTPMGILNFSGILSRLSGIPRSISAFQYFEELWLEREVFDVITPYKIYFDMVIESFNAPRDARTGKALKFSVECVEYRSQTLDSLEIPALRITATERARMNGAKDAGRQQAQQSSSGVQTQSRSILSRTFGS
jgi:hypothetical protein